MQSIVFAGDDSDRLELHVLGYERPPGGEFYDDNWLSVEIGVAAGAFQGRFPASLLTTELRTLCDGVCLLHDSLRGAFSFETMEHQLRLDLKVDSRGYFHADGRAREDASHGNLLTFNFVIEQTYLAPTVAALRNASQAFPVRGRPGA